MDNLLAEKIRQLAFRYETASFIKNDPSQFMHRFCDVRNQEAAAFVAANLAFGRRDQILSHVEAILSCSGKNLDEWILKEEYKSFFPDNSSSFYRMYTNKDMRLFFDGLKDILGKSSSIGSYFEKRWNEEKNNCAGKTDGLYLHQVIASAFDEKCALLPHSKGTAAKKVNMLLRWMVRDNSPVDLGLWKWFSKENLLMPLDTHVMQQANELGLINTRSANVRTCVELTKKMKEIFPDDPVKGDFALFGLGVTGDKGGVEVNTRKRRGVAGE